MHLVCHASDSRPQRAFLNNLDETSTQPLEQEALEMVRPVVAVIKGVRQARVAFPIGASPVAVDVELQFNNVNPVKPVFDGVVKMASAE